MNAPRTPGRRLGIATIVAVLSALVLVVPPGPEPAGAAALIPETGGPYRISEGDELVLEAPPSKAPAWDLDGDGSYDDATGASAVVAWEGLVDLGLDDDGTYKISLQTGDGVATTTLTITDREPTIAVAGSGTAVAGTPYQIRVSATDPGADSINAWTVNWGDGSIDTMRGKPGRLKHTYPTVGLTHDITVSVTDEDGTWTTADVIVAHFDAPDAVGRYDPDTGTAIASLASSKGSLRSASAVTTGPNGLLYVTGASSDNVERYDPDTGAHLGTFVTGGDGGLDRPLSLDFGPDRNLYVASSGSAQILRYDGATGAFIDVFVPGDHLASPRSIVFGRDGALYVADGDDDAIERYDGSTGKHLGTFANLDPGAIPSGLALGPDGNLFVALYGAGRVDSIDGRTGENLGAVVDRGLSAPTGVELGPDGQLWVADYWTEEISRFDARTGAALGSRVTGTSDPGPRQFAFVPNHQVLISRQLPPVASAKPPVDPRPAPAAAFEPNQGQFDDAVDYLARVGAHRVFLSDGDAIIERRNGASSSAVALRWEGNSSTLSAVAEDPTPGLTSYFQGNDPKGWVTGVRSYASVQYEAVYPHIDVEYFAAAQGFRYDLVVNPGGDPAAISLGIEGATSVTINAEGGLDIAMDKGPHLGFSAPYTYQQDGATKSAVPSQYIQKPDGNIGFIVGDYDPALPLVIDPTLQAATYLGGTGIDDGQDIVVDTAGNTYITGSTDSATYPATTGPIGPTAGTDVIVTKLAPDLATVLYTTYVGGKGADTGYGIDIDSAGNAYVAGQTVWNAADNDFPTTVGAWDEVFGNGNDGFVFKLNAVGTALDYSTYLGTTTSNDDAAALAVDGSGRAYVTGQMSNGYTTTPDALQATYGGGMTDAYLTILNPSGTGVDYSTYLGGGNGGARDVGYDIDIDASGKAYIVGQTNNTDFPTSGAPNLPYQAALAGGVDGFVAVIDPMISGPSGLLYSSYLGSAGQDMASGVDAVAGGTFTVIGRTAGGTPAFPTTAGAFDTSHNGNEDVFLAVFDATQSGAASLTYSTLIGDAGDDEGRAVTVDGLGRAYLTGTTRSATYPTTGDAHDVSRGGARDAFLTVLDPAGAGVSDLVYSTYLGGSLFDEGFGIGLDAAGEIYVGGYTQSTDFDATPGAYSEVLGGTQDAFVAGFSSLAPVLVDSDGDGLWDSEEDANNDLDDDPATNPGPDTDGDTSPNHLDADDDGDGTPTASENADPNADGDPRDALDSDRDGQPDYLDLPTGASVGTVDTEQKISETEGGLTATLTTNDHFGRSVAAIGDLDGDGVGDLAVGAHWDNDGGADRGAVYILFLNADGTVRAEQKISDISGGFAATLDNSDEFGTGVAGLGDLDGDGLNDIAVGSHQDDDGAGANYGAVYILFLNADGTVKAEQKISAVEGGLIAAFDPNDRFGSSVANIGDLDGDGLNDIVVGAKDDDDGAADQGAVYVLLLDADGTVKAQQKISGTSGGLSAGLGGSDGFGIGVAGPGDIDGDGTNDIAVGTYWDDDGGTNRGAVYIVFLNPNGTVKADQKISDTAGGLTAVLDNNDEFGKSVGAAGDIDADGVADIVVGTPRDGDGFSLSGAAYVLFLNSNGTVKAEQKISNTFGWPAAPLSTSDQFGYGVTGIGDLDGDGTIGLAVGVYGDDDGGPADRGAVYVLDLTAVASSTLVVNSTGDASDLAPGDSVCDTGGTNSQGDPECTLRAALEEANADSNHTDIDFAIPQTESGYSAAPEAFTIEPATVYPDIIHPVSIDGATQPEHSSKPVIQLDGWSASPATAGLVLETDDSLINALIVHSFADEGLEIDASTFHGQRNTLSNNWVGIDAAETAQANADVGVLITVGAGDNIVTGNVISGNTGSGLVIRNAASDDNTVQGNLIGVGPDGSTPIPNGLHGVEIYDAAASNLIGGADPSEANVVANNTGDGVSLAATAGAGNAFLGNVIHSNGGLGIDLGNDGVTPNSNLDAWLNHPSIVAATESGGTVTVDFDIDVPAGTYRIEAFTNPAGADDTGYGEGQVFESPPETIVHSGSGAESFELTYTGSVDEIVTLTATEDLGSGTYGSTSEFSAAATVGAARVNSTGDTADAVPGDHICDTGGTNSAGDHECTLRAALEEANASGLVNSVAFHIPTSDPGYSASPPAFTIQPGSFLGFITSPVTIDATTQPGFVADPIIQLDGSLATGATAGLSLRTNNSEIRGFIVHSFEDDGLEVDGQTGFGDNNVIAGNWVGFDHTGAPKPNLDAGIIVAVDAVGNQIGGTGPRDANVVGFNADTGIEIRGAGTSDTVIVGNLVGVLPDGVTPAPNGSHGIQLHVSTTSTTIGGTSGIEENVIANNGADGIMVLDTASADNSLLRNTIHSNGGLGIDLGNDGVTPNDDADGWLNYPVISSATASGSSVTVLGAFDVPAGDYRFDFYKNPGGANASGYGEGELWVATTSSSHVGTGPQAFGGAFAGALGEIVTVKITEDLGGGNWGPSSEFSEAITVKNPLIVNSTGDAPDLTPGDDMCHTGGTNSVGDPACTLRAAVEEANAVADRDTIEFNMPASEPGHAAGNWTITPGSTLPSLSTRINVDAATQPGYFATPIVSLHGASATGASGLSITAAADLSEVTALMITGFDGDGIFVASGADGITITDNWIGSDGSGAAPMGNGDDGIDLWGTNAVIDGNVVNHSDDEGIDVRGAGATITRNMIGLEFDGSAGAGNSDVGIAVFAGNTTIGGDTVAKRNVISMNWEGIEINSSNNVIQGNYIGTDSTGALDRGNRIGDGVEVQAGSGNLIGGASSNEGNLVAYNQLKGIDITGGNGNSVLGNDIHDNGGLGIDITGGVSEDIFGVTPNDPGDADTGPNNRLNFPVITSATEVAGTITIDFDLDVPAGDYRVELFKNPGGADPSTHGEGEIYVDSSNVAAHPGGLASYTTTTAGTFGDLITATATEEVAAPFGATSEFSAAVTVSASNSPPTLDPIGDKAVDELALLAFTITASDTDVTPSSEVRVSDSFTEAANTTLPAHTPDIGTGWTAVYDSSTAVSDAAIDPALDVVEGGSSENFVGQAYTAQPAPSGVDQSISFTLSVLETDNGTKPVGMFGRRADNDNFYLLQVLPNTNGQDSLKLFKYVSGVQTELGSIDATLSPGDTLKLELTDATKKVFRNGSEVLSSPDNALVAPGTWGLFWGDFNGASCCHLRPSWGVDDFLAEEPGTDTDTLTFSAVGLPLGATLDPVTGAFAWTPSETQGGGVYPVTFTVTDDGTPNLDDSESIDITVDDTNAAPIADAGGPYAIAEGAPLTLDASGSTDSDVPADTLSYAWDLDNDSFYDDATGLSPTINWATLVSLGLDDDGGPFAIGLEVDDGTTTHTDTASLTITNAAPSISVTGTGTAYAGSSYVVTLGATDPGDDSVTAWTINWGDGEIDTIAGNPSSASHTYQAEGPYNLTAAATDEDGIWWDGDFFVPGFTSATMHRYAPVTASPGSPFGALSAPLAAVIGPDGLLYVADFGADTVEQYDPATGSLVSTFVTTGSGALDGPVELAFGPDGNLYVASSYTDTVERYDGTSGAHLDTFVTAGDGGLSSPAGMAFGPNGDLYIAGSLSDAVHRYDGSTGSYIDDFVAPSAGGLNGPEDLVFTPAGAPFSAGGDLLVANGTTDEILRFDDSGAPLAAFVAAGAGGLDAPKGLGFGPDGMLYVGSELTSEVMRYSGTSGAYLDTFVTAGSGGLAVPTYFAFTPEHQVVVASGTAVSGTVYEDLDYGGGPGRDLADASGVGRGFATVELYDAAGDYVATTLTAGDGSYTFDGLIPATYTVRVVNASTSSSRTGGDGSELGIQTYRTDSLSELVGTGTNRVGGEQTDAVDAPPNDTTQTLADLQAPPGQYTQSIVTLDASTAVTDVDFGFNFDTIVNTNETDQGSLHQFLLNANLLDDDLTLGQVGQTPGIETSIFAMPTTDPGHSSGVWTITTATTPLPVITAPVAIDGSTQPGWASLPVIEVDGTGLGGAASGLDIGGGADDSEIGHVAVVGYPEHGIVVAADRVRLHDLHVGVRADGVTGAGNSTDGIEVNGDDTEIRDSVIGDHPNAGIDLVEPSGGTVIIGNRIGTDAGGTLDLGNQIGVWADTSSGALIGGTTPADANVIANSTFDGVSLGAAARSIAVLGNVIRDNGELGIDIDSSTSNGVTANDPGDGDGGSNNRLNFPVPVLATVRGTVASITYTLDVPAGNYRIEFFANPGGADPTGHGEGEAFLGAAPVTHPGGGPVLFEHPIAAALGDTISATATADLGAGAHGATSEFSTVIQAMAAASVTVHDASQRRSDLRAGGGVDAAAPASGIAGRAFDLDGSDDRLLGPPLDVTDAALTMAAWVRPDTTSGSPRLVSKRTSAGAPIYELSIDTPTANAVATIRVGGTPVSVAGGSVTAGAWHFIAATWDGTELILHVDGAQVASAAAPGALATDTTMPMSVGDTAVGSAPFDGLIEQVMVLHRPLTVAEIIAQHRNVTTAADSITFGDVQTAAPGSWTVSTAQARSGATALAAPETSDPGAAAWAVATGIDEPGLVFESWWWVSDATGVDLSSGTRASGAPTSQLEAALLAASGWELRQRSGSAQATDAPPAGTPVTGAWVKVEVWTDQLGQSRLFVDGVEVTTWTDQSTSPLMSGSVALRAGTLPSGADWYVDDPRARKLITPEPVTSLGPLDRD